MPVRTEVSIPVMRPRLPSWESISRYGRLLDESRIYSNFGPLVAQLEGRLASHFSGDPGSVLTVANGTLGLAITLQEIALEGKRHCLMPSWTFVATPHAAVTAGLEPFFADVDPIHGMLTPAIAEAALRECRTIGSVVVVGPFGMAVPIDEWLDFQARTGIPVVIDAAACFDSATLTVIPTVVSLHATKALGCGEGGFIMSADLDLISRLTRRSNFGFYNSRQATVPALNAKMSEFHAAVALAALDAWPQTRGALMDVAKHYVDALAGRDFATLPQGWSINWVSTTLNVYLTRGARGSRFDVAMAEAGIDIRRWWENGCHLHVAFAHCLRQPLPVTAEHASRSVGVPFSIDLTATQVRRVVAAIEATVAQS